MSLRDDNAKRTRHAVLRSARRLFARRGFAGTSVDEIARAGRVTKGAVYHHFADKTDVFRAVYEELSADLAARLSTIAQTRPPREALAAALELMLDDAEREDVRTILYRDGARVLGAEARAIDQRHYLGLLEEALASIVGPEVDSGVLGRLLLAALVEGSQWLGEAEDVEAAKAALRGALARLFAGVL